MNLQRIKLLVNKLTLVVSKDQSILNLQRNTISDVSREERRNSVPEKSDLTTGFTSNVKGSEGTLPHTGTLTLFHMIPSETPQRNSLSTTYGKRETKNPGTKTGRRTLHVRPEPRTSTSGSEYPIFPGPETLEVLLVTGSDQFGDNKT